MNVSDAIKKRKSIRKWEDRQVPDEVINELLEAARLAPSAKNAQSHKYFLVKEKETKEKLVKSGAFKREFVGTAPVIIVCCADAGKYPESVEVDDTPSHYAYIDLSIAASFLTLRATELGLGTVFVAWIYCDVIRKVLNIPENYIIPYVIPVGYPAEEGRPTTRKDLKEIVF